MQTESPFAFISYAHTNKELALRLHADLDVKGFSTWLDLEDLLPGTRDWQETLRKEIPASYAVILLVSPQSRMSIYVKAELQIADMYAVPVYCVWIAGTTWSDVVPLSMMDKHFIDARGPRYESGLEEIASTLHVLLVKARQARTVFSDASDFIPRNPYKGLHAFTQDDTQDFFGRKQLVKELAKTLKELLSAEEQNTQGNQSTRLLALLGASGSGKSSVLQAGLLPYLRGGGITGSKHWVYLDPIVPGSHPIQSLNQALEKHSKQLSVDTQKFTQLQSHGDYGRELHVRMEELIGDRQTKVILPVDQFEEVFSPSVSELERLRFIELLVHAATEPYGPLIVLLTLRADFYDRHLTYHKLSKLIQAHQHIILAMREVHDLREVIEGPAALPDVQLTFDTDLVGDLLFESKDEVGALPLLEFTLQQLFLRREGHRLTRQAYHELGGVTEILFRQAEQVYEQLPTEAHRQAARQVFLRLVEVHEPFAQSTRLRVPIIDFVTTDKSQTALLQEVQKAFVDARLLTFTPATPQPTLEISHEILLRKWGRLIQWVQKAQQDLPLQEKLRRDVATWERANHPKDQLYRGSQLREARALSHRFLPNEREAAFLHASRVHQQRTRFNLGVLMLLMILLLGIATQLFLQPRPNTHIVNKLSTVVTTLADDGPGSLRQIILTANSGSTITFAPSLSGIVTLAGSDLNISKNLKIQGPKNSAITIGSDTKGYEIVVSDGITITLSHLNFQCHTTNKGKLTLLDSIISGVKGGIFEGQKELGFGNYGAIRNDGILTITNSNISKNTGEDSGGIYNDGLVTITNSSILHNKGDALNGGGGGIYNTGGGTISLVKSTVSDNLESNFGNSFGGGIYNCAGCIITLANSSIFNNKVIAYSRKDHKEAIGVGGGVYNEGTFVANNSTIFGNSATNGKNENGGGSGFGGGIYNAQRGLVTLTNSIISRNTAIANKQGATGDGGGVFNYGGTFTITNSTVTMNKATSTYWNSYGGGILNQDSQKTSAIMTITSSTIANNGATSNQGSYGGGIYNYGDAHDSNITLNNSTLFGNYASREGGGFFNVGDKGKAAITFCTIADNSAPHGGGIATDIQDPSLVALRNSIVVNNRAITGLDIEGILTSQGYNLLQHVTNATFTIPLQAPLTDIAVVYPGIEFALQNHGGSTQTLALLSNSPAVDAIPLSACHIAGITTDQRGMKRSDSNEKACDIGAYELIDT